MNSLNHIEFLSPIKVQQSFISHVNMFSSVLKTMKYAETMAVCRVYAVVQQHRKRLKTNVYIVHHMNSVTT